MTNEQSGVKNTGKSRAGPEGTDVIRGAYQPVCCGKRAGLANGTLNYNCPEYRQVRRLSAV